MPDLVEASKDDEALLSFLYMCPVGLLRTSAAGEVRMINPKAAQLLAPLSHEPMPLNLFDALELCAPELRGMATRFSAVSGSICEQYRIFVSSSGPGPRVLACSLLKINSDCLMAVLQDVTKQVEQERKLRQNEAMFAALVAGVKDFALFSLDQHGYIDSWNLSCERRTGFKAAEVSGRDLGILSLPGKARADNVADQVAEAVRDGWSLRDRWCARRDGTRFWCQIMVAADRELETTDDGEVRPVIPPDKPADAHAPIAGFAVVLRDVTEQHVSGQELRRLLTTDYLTGAANRGRFFELAEIEIARSRRDGSPVSVLMLDLDRFKRVNDCYGHAAGDLVLQRVVGVCGAQLRGRDVLARVGGEEFAVMLPDTGLQDSVGIAERIRLAVAAQIVLPTDPCLDGEPGPLGPVGVSLGCATLTASMVGIDDLLKAADRALYEAKRAGRGQVRAVGQDVPAPASTR